jgi:glycopeptide antibiotics resistance protein
MFLRHPILSIATAGYLGVVGWMTLGPQPFTTSSDSLIWRVLGVLNHFPFLRGFTYAQLEFTGNVLMFLPIGLFFVLLLGRARWWLAVVLGVLLTITIEFTQLFLPGRVSDVRDILANSVGAFVGVLVALVLTARKARRLRRQRVLASRPRTVTSRP